MVDTHTHWYGRSLIAGMLHTTSIFIAHGLAHGGHTHTDMDSLWSLGCFTLHPSLLHMVWHMVDTHTLIWTVSDRWDASHYIHLYCSWFGTWWTHTHWYGQSLIAGMLHTTSIFIAHGLAHGGHTHTLIWTVSDRWDASHYIHLYCSWFGTWWTHTHWYGQSLIAGMLHTTSIFIAHGLAHGGHTHTLIWTVSDRWDASHYIHLYCSWFGTWWTHTHWYGQSLIAGMLHTTSIFIVHGLAHGGHTHTLIWTVCDRWDASHYIHLYCSWFSTWWTHTHTDMDCLWSLGRFTLHPSLLLMV